MSDFYTPPDDIPALSRAKSLQLNELKDSVVAGFDAVEAEIDSYLDILSAAAASEAAAAASEAAAAEYAENAAMSALEAEGYADALTTTSVSSVSIGTGSKTFTVGPNLKFAQGQFVSVISTSDSTKYMHGTVTSYSGSTLIINVPTNGTSGSGTYASWGISLSGAQGPIGVVSDTFTMTPAPATDHTASGVIASMTCGETISIGNLCYIKSDGLMWKTDADAAATMPGVAIALGSQSAGNATNFLFYGFFRDDSYAWTVGSLLYASGTAGAITATAPSGTTDVVQAVAVATHADRIFFNPSLVTATVV